MTAKVNRSGAVLRTLRARLRTETRETSRAIRITAGADDIALMRAMNLNSYRFSISWPRIQPSGSGSAHQKEVSITTGESSMRCSKRTSDLS